MGNFDSSITRVKPAFEELLTRADATWLEALIALPTRTGATMERSVGDKLLHHAFEERLEAPRSALEWLIRNPGCLKRPPDFASTAEHTQRRREQLLQGDEETRAEALALLARRRRGWHVLEGPTCPDVVLETEKAIIVIEGKRTERGATTSTTWWPGRHQMLRHLDAAWDLRDGRKVCGFFVVEGDPSGEVPSNWREECDKTVDPQTLAGSLPHRSIGERTAIAEAFLGATTWQQIAQRFNLGLMAALARPFKFDRYDVAELHACANALRSDACAIWMLADTESWTELVLDWFAAAAPSGVLVNARRQRDLPALARWRWPHVGLRTAAGEWMLDLTHSTYPGGSEAAYWRLALEEDCAREVRLGLESEWGRFGDETMSRNAILNDASKIAAIRADVKVMITGAAPAWAGRVEEDLRRLRVVTRDPAPWLWANLAHSDRSDDCRFEVFDAP